MKKIIILSLLTLSFIFIFNLKNIYKSLSVSNQVIIKSFLLKKYDSLSNTSKILIRALKLEPFKQLEKRYKRENPNINNLNNDYNVKFLPETQDGKFNLIKYKINFNEKSNKQKDTGYGFFRSFFIEIFDDSLIVVNNNAEILFSKLDEILKKNTTNLKFKSIKSNLILEGSKNSKIMGTLIYDKKIFVS